MVMSTEIPPREGLGNYVWNLSRRLKGLGHEVEIFTRGTPGQQVATTTHDGIPVNRARFAPLHPFHVHLHGAFLSNVLKKRRDDFDLLHFHTPLPPALNSVRLPALLTFHTPVRADTAAIATNDWMAWMYRAQTPVSVALEKALIRRAQVVSAVSSSTADDLSREYAVPRESIRILHNGVDPERFTVGGSAREGFILCTGRLGPRKGHPDLLRALAILKQEGHAPRTVITGRGPLESQLKAQAERLDLNDIVDFRGFVERDELLSLLRRCRLFVFPTHYEGLPTSILEAMSTACPIVTTAAPGVVDLIEHRRNGILTRVGDPHALAEAIRMLGDAPALAKTLGQTARDDVVKRYSWNSIVERTEVVYREMIG